MNKDNKLYTWNPVFNFVMDVKSRYVGKFCKPEYKTYLFDNKEISCLEYWIRRLDENRDYEKIKYLEINQEREFVLLRYARFSSVIDGEIEFLSHEFWEQDDGFFRECRSIVIDLSQEKIVLAPFRKFHNLNEVPENAVDIVTEEIKNAKLVEITNKLDGSMQSVSWYNGAIFMAGSQALSREKSWRLADGYSRLTDSMITASMMNRHWTFIYEYIALKDSHVVKYTKEQEGLYLIGIRDNLTGRQFSYKEVAEIAHFYNIPMTEIYDKTFADVLAEVKVIKSDQQEGFVLNIDGHMIKVKGDDYVHIHRVLSQISSINLVIRAIAENQIDDVYSKVPTAYKSRITSVEKVVRRYVAETDKIVRDLYEKAPKTERKEFMLWIDANVPKKYRGFVRNMYLGKESNYLKRGSAKTPHYLKLTEMGVTDYKSIFKEDDDV